jgi:hypothetical protein
MVKWLQENVSWVLPMLVGIAVTFFVTRRYGARRSRISLAWETVALLNRHADSADLEVLHKGEPVSEPHLVTIELRCPRPHDITEDNFHADEPWKIIFTDAAPLSVAGADIDASVDPEQRALLIPPQHLPAGPKVRLTVVTKGRTRSLSTTALVNTDSRVRYGTEQRLPWKWIGPLLFVAFTAAGALWGFLLEQQGVVVDWYEVMRGLTAIVPFLFLMGLLASAVILASAALRRRRER